MISAMRINDEWYLRSEKAGCGERRGGLGSKQRRRSPLRLAQVVGRRLGDEHVGLARIAVALRNRNVLLRRARRRLGRRHLHNPNRDFWGITREVSQ